MAVKIQAYFDSCKEHWEDFTDWVAQKDGSGKEVVQNGAVVYDEVKKKRKVDAKVPTITGLAVFLETSRETLLDYEKDYHFEEGNDQIGEADRRAFSDTIKRAKDYIHEYTESILLNGGAHPAGVIFSLKNNYGWKDKTELDVKSDDKPLGYALIPAKTEEKPEDDSKPATAGIPPKIES